MSNLPVLIIAGGANSRFFPFHTLGHKGAFQLLGQALLIRTLEDLIEHDFSRVVLVITPQDAAGHFSQRLVEQSGLSVEITYCIQAEARGMGDAVLQGVQVLAEHDRQRFGVISAYHVNAGKMLSQMMEHGTQTVLSVAETDHPWDYGILTLNEDQQAVNIIEKPVAGKEPSALKVLSVYILTSDFTSLLQATALTEYNFEDALRQKLQQLAAPVVKYDDADVPSLKFPWQLFQFQHQLLQQLSSYRAESAQVAATAVIDEAAGPVYIDEQVLIGHCARVVGPCYLGKGVQIGDFVLVRDCSLEEGTHLGCFTEAARTIFGKNIHFHSGYIGDSIVGDTVRVGADFISANKRLDRQSIGVNIKGRIIDSGRRRLGVLIGSAAQIGIRVGTMPGKIIAANAQISAGSIIRTNTEQESVT